jgi:hypothetical protein
LKPIAPLRFTPCEAASNNVTDTGEQNGRR